MSLIY